MAPAAAGVPPADLPPADLSQDGRPAGASPAGRPSGIHDTAAGTVTAAILGLAGTVLTTAEAAFFREADPWGFILFARNVESPAQLRRLTADLRAAVGRDAPIFVDQEGGRVQRLRPPHWRDWRPAREDAAGTGAERRLWLRGRLMAAELHAVGIDANCAPLLDVARTGTHPFLANRCLGETPERVAQLGRAMAEGMLAGGVLPVVKHLPGHGSATVDSHLALPTAAIGAAEARAVDFAPFRALADMPMAMTAHVLFPAFDAVAPATCSAAVIGLIREEIGFDGLLMTDDISMGALSGTVGARTAAARVAGCDVVLHCNGDAAEAAAVVAEAGSLSAAGAARAGRALSRRVAPDRIDMAALEAEFGRL